MPAPAALAVGLVLAGLGAVLLSGALAGDPGPRVLGPDRAINEGGGDRADIRAHNSPTIVRNPVRPANLVVANRVDTPEFSCALRVSFDGGGRWSTTQVPLPPGEEPKCFAPDLAFAADGTLHLSFVTLRGAGNVPNAGWVASSRNGGRTLSAPRRVLGPLAFQVRVAAHPRDPRRLYLSWLQASGVGLYRFEQPGNPIQVARSLDAGTTWQAPVRASPPARPRVVAPSPAVGPRGEVYVLYLDLGDDRLDYEGAHEGYGGPPHPGAFRLVLSRSRDGGASWSESVVEERLVPTERFLAFLPPFPSLAVDSRSGRVYAGFHDGRLGAPDVWVWSLEADAGAWRGPVRVNDTRERDGTSQYLPKLAVAPNGRLDVVYYDRRSDPANVRNEVSLQSSLDGGESFTSRVALSSRPFDSRIGFGSERDLPELGSRLGLVSEDRRALAVWSDTRAGTVASNKQDIGAAVVGFGEPARLSATARAALRYGGIALALVGAVVLVTGGTRGRSVGVVRP